MKNSFITGSITANGLTVPQLSTGLRFTDFMGAVMVRWGFNRDRYSVAPGLYAIGSPGAGSDVFVTANYKLTFDHVRKSLSGSDAWILVLDTKGVNVWCAAGKGTFGTVELVNRIRATALGSIVDHRRLILPQLGATGVAAHRVKEETGFNVHYGPVRAADIRKFVKDGYRADREMRRVKFGFFDRLKLIPNDFMYGKFYLLIAILVSLLLAGIDSTGISWGSFSLRAGPAAFTIIMAYFAGLVFTPALLPWIPGRYFSLKGFFSGMAVFIVYLLMMSSADNYMVRASWFFITGAISSFLAMNFTGSTTFTSLSGVKKEMKIFMPLQIGFAAVGIILQTIGKIL